MRDFYVKIENGTSVSTFDIYWDSINPSYYATLQGTTASATGLTFLQMTTDPGVLVEVPNGATSIILNSSQPTFCPGVGSTSMIYSYNLPVPPAPDTTPPDNSGASVIFVSSTSTTITCSWSGFTDNVGIDHYIIEIADSTYSLIYTSPNLSSSTLMHTATGLTDNTDYYYLVWAYDAAGNSSHIASGLITTPITNSVTFRNSGGTIISPNLGYTGNLNGTVEIVGASATFHAYSIVYGSGNITTNMTINGNSRSATSTTGTVNSTSFTITPGSSYSFDLTITISSGSGEGGIGWTQ